MTCAILSKEYKICRLTVKQKERQNKRIPIRDISRTSDGGMVITTGNESGYIVRYTFTEE